MDWSVLLGKILVDMAARRGRRGGIEKDGAGGAWKTQKLYPVARLRRG